MSANYPYKSRDANPWIPITIFLGFLIVGSVFMIGLAVWGVLNKTNEAQARQMDAETEVYKVQKQQELTRESDRIEQQRRLDAIEVQFKQDEYQQKLNQDVERFAQDSKSRQDFANAMTIGVQWAIPILATLVGLATARRIGRGSLSLKTENQDIVHRQLGKILTQGDSTQKNLTNHRSEFSEGIDLVQEKLDGISQSVNRLTEMEQRITKVEATAQSRTEEFIQMRDWSEKILVQLAEIGANLDRMQESQEGKEDVDREVLYRLLRRNKRSSRQYSRPENP